MFTNSSPGQLTLSAQDGRLPPAGAAAATLHFLEHRRVLQHVGQDEEADLAAADVDVLKLRRSPVAVRHVDVGELAVHVVLGLQQLATVHLPGVRLARHDVTLSLVQNLDRNSDRHFEIVFRTLSHAQH